MTRTVTMTIVREFTFEIEVEDDVPPITDAKEFYEIHGTMNVSDDSIIVSEDIDDPAA